MPTGRRLGPDANPPERRDQSDEDSEPGQGLFNENITREELLQVRITCRDLQRPMFEAQINQFGIDSHSFAA